MATELTPLTVTVLNQSTGYTWNISALIRNLSYTTVEPGGCEQASFHIPVNFVDRTLTVPPFLQMFYQMRILDELGCVWIGRLEEIGLDIDENGGQWAVVAYGYGVRANDQITADYNVRNLNNLTDVIPYAINNLMVNPVTGTSVLNSYQITATGFTFNNSSDTHLKNITAGGLIAYMRAFGTSTYQAVQWTVYPSNSGSIIGYVRPIPTAPDLRSRLIDFGRASFKANGRSYANRVNVQYDSGNSSAVLDNTSLQGVYPGGVNMIRTIAAVANEFHDPGDIGHLTQTLLNWASAIRLSAAGSYTTGGSTRFRDESNGQWNVTPRRVRAGQFMAITDMVTLTTGSSNLAFNNSFLIARTRWDEDSNTLTITPDSFESAAERAWAQVRGTLMGRITLV